MKNQDSDKGLGMANTKKDKKRKAVDQKTRRKNMKSDNDPNTAQVNLNTEILKKAKLALAEMSKVLNMTQKNILETLILNTYEALLDYRTDLERKGWSQREIASFFPLTQPQNIRITPIQVGNSNPRSNAFAHPRSFQKSQSDLDSIRESISNTDNSPSPTDTQKTNATIELSNREEATTSNPLKQQGRESPINVPLNTTNVSASVSQIVTRQVGKICTVKVLKKPKSHNISTNENNANNNHDKSDNDLVNITTKE